MLNCRSLLQSAALAGASTLAARATDTPAAKKPDYTLRIAPGLVDRGPGHIVSTTLYIDQFPDPLLRLTESKPVIVDVRNDTDVPELVYRHGQIIPSQVDGAAEEGSPFYASTWHAAHRVEPPGVWLALVSNTRTEPLETTKMTAVKHNAA